MGFHPYWDDPLEDKADSSWADRADPLVDTVDSSWAGQADPLVDMVDSSWAGSYRALWVGSVLHPLGK